MNQLLSSDWLNCMKIVLRMTCKYEDGARERQNAGEEVLDNLEYLGHTTNITNNVEICLKFKTALQANLSF